MAFKQILFLVIFSCGSLLSAQSISPVQAQMAAQVQQMQRLQIQLQGIVAQLDAVVRAQNELNAKVMRLESRLNDGQSDALVAVKRDLTFLKGEQAKLRQEIVADLTKKITQIVPPKPVAKKPALPPISTTGREHVVEQGQTLTEIAQAYKQSVKVIMRANKISNPSLIRVGQKLFIPD